MKFKKWIYSASIVAGAVFISHFAFSKLDNFTSMNRAGDPVGPGVTTSKNCTTCHSGGDPVSNNTDLRVFTFGTGGTSYLADSTYIIKFKIRAANPVGFSATVLKNDSNIMAGTMASIDTNETKLFLHLASGRYYMNHRVGVTTAGEKEYSFKWTAPRQGSGPVTFYFGSLTSNNDASNDFDTTYLNSYVITEGTIPPPVGISTISKPNSFVAYPNPASERIDVNFTNADAGQTTVALYSVTGQKSVTLLNEELNAGEQNLHFDLSGKVTPGIYFLSISNASMNSVKKILIY